VTGFQNIQRVAEFGIFRDTSSLRFCGPAHQPQCRGLETVVLIRRSPIPDQSPITKLPGRSPFRWRSTMRW
jgi:hypothetical protein